MTDLTALMDLHKKARDNSADQIPSSSNLSSLENGQLGLSGTRISGGHATKNLFMPPVSVKNQLAKLSKRLARVQE